MNVLKCDICGKIFEYTKSFVDLNGTENDNPVKERIFNKVSCCHMSRPIRDKYDDGNLITLYSYDVCPSCARRLAEFISKERTDHEDL